MRWKSSQKSLCHASTSTSAWVYFLISFRAPPRRSAVGVRSAITRISILARNQSWSFNLINISFCLRKGRQSSGSRQAAIEQERIVNRESLSKKAERAPAYVRTSREVEVIKIVVIDTRVQTECGPGVLFITNLLFLSFSFRSRFNSIFLNCALITRVTSLPATLLMALLISDAVTCMYVFRRETETFGFSG